jgi:hypothetical protein
LGSRALCVGDPGKAHWYLSSALSMRESLGDTAGAATSRHNLEFVGPPPVPESAQPRAQPERRRGGRRLMLMLTVIALSIAAIPVLLLPGGGGGPPIVQPPPSSVGSPPAGLIVGPVRLDFGRVSVGERSLPQLVTVTNAGNVATSVNVQVSGTNSSAFLVVRNTCDQGPLMPHDSCETTVSFRPDHVGAHSALLEVRLQRRSGKSISLTGIGT